MKRTDTELSLPGNRGQMGRVSFDMEKQKDTFRKKTPDIEEVMESVSKLNNFFKRLSWFLRTISCPLCF